MSSSSYDSSTVSSDSRTSRVAGRNATRSACEVALRCPVASNLWWHHEAVSTWLRAACDTFESLGSLNNSMIALH
jgi:hypothetical protein